MQSTLFSARELSHSRDSPEYNRELPSSDFQTALVILLTLLPFYQESLAKTSLKPQRPAGQKPSLTFLLNAAPEHHAAIVIPIGYILFYEKPLPILFGRRSNSCPPS
jgi:hypothetical protein